MRAVPGFRVDVRVSPFGDWRWRVVSTEDGSEQECGGGTSKRDACRRGHKRARQLAVLNENLEAYGQWRPC